MSSVDESFSDEQSESGETLVDSVYENPSEEDEVIAKKNVRNYHYMMTLNNYTAEEVEDLKSIDFKYLAIGFEVGESGTPHLQVFFTCKSNPTLSAVRKMLTKNGLRRAAQLQVAIAPIAAYKYCLKGSDANHPDWKDKPFSPNEVFEKGDRPQGPRAIAESIKNKYENALREARATSTCSDASILIRHYKTILAIGEAEKAKKKVKTSLIVDLRPWQQELVDYIKQPPHSREIRWYYDPVGGKGKSQMAKYLYENFVGAVFLRGGKDADQAMMLPEVPKIVVFDYARSKTSLIQYSFIESVKDGTVPSPKYQSKMLIFDMPHVIVFSNQLPEPGQMSEDRITVINL